MAEDTPKDPVSAAGARVATFFSPAVCAVSSFTLAVLALMGQNVVTAGVSLIVDEVRDDASGGFYLGFGLAVIVQVVVALLLARKAIVSSGPWEPTLGRAAVVVCVVALVAAVLTIIGGELQAAPFGA